MRQTMLLVAHFLGFFVVLALLLLAMVLVLERVAPDQPGPLLAAIFGVLVVVLLLAPVLLHIAMRRSLVFPPEPGVAPLPEAELRARLRALAETGAPVELIETGPRMRFRWRYLDAALRGLLEARKLSSAYELQVRLDGARHEAVLTDVKRSLRLSAGTGGAKLGMGMVRGWLTGVEIGRGYEIGSDLGLREVYDYRLEPAELKRPVQHTLAEAGWTVRYGLW